MGREEPRAKSVSMDGKFFQEKALRITSESGDGGAEKTRYDVPQGVGVKNRYEAELTNPRRGSGSKI